MSSGRTPRELRKILRDKRKEVAELRKRLSEYEPKIPPHSLFHDECDEQWLNHEFVYLHNRLREHGIRDCDDKIGLTIFVSIMLICKLFMNMSWTFVFVECCLFFLWSIRPLN